jgi:hypothetical protein
MTDGEAHDGGEIADQRFETRRHQADLPQSQIPGHLNGLGHFQRPRSFSMT